jgi:hypothetical protein
VLGNVLERQPKGIVPSQLLPPSSQQEFLLVKLLEEAIPEVTEVRKILTRVLQSGQEEMASSQNPHHLKIRFHLYLSVRIENTIRESTA